MVAFHLVWDLGNFNYIDPDIPFSPGFKLIGHAIATSFLFIAGVSLVLAHRQKAGWRPFRRRLFIISGAAALVSLGTWLAYPQAFVFFGILHCIAAASLLAAPLLTAPWPAAAAAALAFGLAPLLYSSPIFNTRWLAWIGFAGVEPLTNDYQPLAPWAAALFAGVAAAKFWSARFSGDPDSSVFSSREAAPASLENTLGAACWLGRRSLAVYLLHQPALFALFGLLALLGAAPAARVSGGFLEACSAQCEKGGGEKTACRDICSCTEEKASRDASLALAADEGERALIVNRLAQACLSDRLAR
ncbi:DUF1624 domain-containing protein [Methylocystis heyeri]|uniref:DUF1624 domain-containing protein n=2 Tax=Methylocystis heyeri TaxID=391905 RepID=A0A6B8KK80_9HYPH|nr:DUF1624 domain-containing protein [Methylocystis heyeri]